MSNSEERFVKLYTKILDNKIIKDSRALQLYIFCLCNARVKKTKYHDVGTLIVKQEEIAETLDVSISTVKRFLKILKEEGYIEYEGLGDGTYIKVVNFEKYNPYKEKSRYQF